MVAPWWPTLKRKPVESHCLFSPPFSHYARPMCTMSEKRVCIDETLSEFEVKAWKVDFNKYTDIKVNYDL